MNKYLRILAAIISVVTVVTIVSYYNNLKISNAYAIRLSVSQPQNILDDIERLDQDSIVPFLTYLVVDGEYNVYINKEGLQKIEVSDDSTSNQYSNKLFKGGEYIDLASLGTINFFSLNHINDNQTINDSITIYTIGSDQELRSFFNEIEKSKFSLSSVEPIYEARSDYIILIVILMILYTSIALIIAMSRMNRNSNFYFLNNINGRNSFKLTEIYYEKNKKKNLIIMLFFINAIVLILYQSITLWLYLIGSLVYLALYTVENIIEYVLIHNISKFKKLLSLKNNKILFPQTDVLNYLILLLVKGMFFLGMIAIVFSLQHNYYKISTYNQWSKIEDTYYPPNVVAGDEANVKKETVNRYKYLNYIENKTESMYAISQEFGEDEFFLIANSQYLELNDVKVDEKKRGKGPLLFIPSGYSKEQVSNAVNKKLSIYYNQDAKNDYAYYDLEQLTDYQIINYDSKNLYSYNLSMSENNGYYTNPVVYVPSKENLSHEIAFYAFQNLIYRAKDNEEATLLNKTFFEDNSFPYNDDDFLYNSKYSEYSNELKKISMFVVTIFVLIIIFLLLYFITLRNSLDIYIRENSRRIVLTRIKGDTLISVYKSLFLSELSITLMFSLFFLLFLKLIGIGNIWIIILTIIFIYCNYFCIQRVIKKNEKRNILNILKGG